MKRIIALLCLIFAFLPALLGCKIVRCAVSEPMSRITEIISDEISEINDQIVCNIADEIKSDVYDLNPSELDELKKLQFTGYRDLTIDEYKNYVSMLLDEPKYGFLTEEYLNGDQIKFGLRDKDPMANYFYYVLGPLTCAYNRGEFGDYLTKTAEDGSFRLCLEYDAYIEVLKPEMVTVGEYEQTLDNIKNAVRDMFCETEIPEDWQMYYEYAVRYENIIENKIQDIISGISNDKLRINIDYVIYAEEGEELFYYDSESYEEGKPQLIDADEKYLSSLLKLMTEDCAQMPLGEFNEKLLEWANDDAERAWRIDELVKYGGIKECDLTEAQLYFIETTVELSGMENGKYLEFLRDGIERRPYLRVKFETVEPFCYFECLLSYEIIDPNTITVGERDKTVKNAENEIENYWFSLSENEKLSIAKDKLENVLERIAEDCSNDEIKIYVDKIFLDREVERTSND